MLEKEIEFDGGSLKYEIVRDTVRITQYNGMASIVEIPDLIEGIPVTCIGKKTFLSRKALRKISLPIGLTEVEDWAFAYCDGLKEVILPRNEIRFGRSIFLECSGLDALSCHKTADVGQDDKGEEKTQIIRSGSSQIYETKTGQGMDCMPEFTEGIAHLLAAAVTKMEANYLLDLMEAGSREWLKKWDAKLEVVLDTPDTEGYSHQVLCGEEDYGSTDLNAYISGRRKYKIRLAMLRLLYPTELDLSLRTRLEEYIKAYTKGCETEESWEIIYKEHGADREYYELFAKLEGIHSENLSIALEDVGENYPEMKAYYIARFQKTDAIDFFDSLEL